MALIVILGESQYLEKKQTYVVFPLNHPYPIYQIYNLFISFIHLLNEIISDIYIIYPYHDMIDIYPEWLSK
ncbi:unnamed protein product [Camellia sinensis]